MERRGVMHRLTRVTWAAGLLVVSAAMPFPAELVHHLSGGGAPV